MTEQQQFFQHIDTIIDKYYEEGMANRGGAWMTGMCDVGSDIMKGASEASDIIRQYDFENYVVINENATLVEHALNLSKILDEEADNYDGTDVEGFVVRTMGAIARDIGKLAETFNQKD